MSRLCCAWLAQICIDFYTDLVPGILERLQAIWGSQMQFSHILQIANHNILSLLLLTLTYWTCLFFTVWIKMKLMWYLMKNCNLSKGRDSKVKYYHLAVALLCFSCLRCSLCCLVWPSCGELDVLVFCLSCLNRHGGLLWGIMRLLKSLMSTCHSWDCVPSHHVWKAA